jgi:hypothetical protein
MLPTTRSAIALARGARMGVRMMRDVDCGEDGVEGSGELGVAVADEEPKATTGIVEVDEEIAGLLGQPGCGGVGGDAKDVHVAGGVLDDEEDIQPAQVIVSRWSRSQARIECAWARGDSVHDGPARRGEGAMPALCKMVPTVEAPIRQPRPIVSPWMRRYPQVGFSAARRRTRARRPAGMAGRPGGLGVVVQRRVTSWRCQRRIVAGVTSSPRRRGVGSSRVSAAIRARSVQLILGRLVHRWSTASW